LSETQNDIMARRQLAPEPFPITHPSKKKAI
jgi:hypothetical protein